MHHVFAAGVAVVGIVVSLYALVSEKLRWNSLSTFAVTTKLKVVILCITGPIAMVTCLLYGFLAFLLATERATSTCFYISASWTVIFTDMCMILYRDARDLCRQKVDLSLQFVNVFILLYTFANMPYTPTSFVLISAAGWGSLVMSRVFKRYIEKHRPRLPSTEEVRKKGRLMGQSSSPTHPCPPQQHLYHQQQQQQQQQQQREPLSVWTQKGPSSTQYHTPLASSPHSNASPSSLPPSLPPPPQTSIQQHYDRNHPSPP